MTINDRHVATQFVRRQPGNVSESLQARRRLPAAAKFWEIRRTD